MPPLSMARKLLDWKNWKKHWKWIVLGIGVFIILILVIVLIVLLASGSGSESKSESGSSSELEELGSGSSSNGSPAGEGDSPAGEGDSPAGEEYQKIALDYHNARRKEHQVGPLQLDKDLTAKAEKCAKYYVTQRGGIDHSCPHRGKVGENLYSTPWGGYELSAMAERASRLWYEEVNEYNFDKPGSGSSKNGKMVLHFTAMMWKASKKLGVGAYKTDYLSVVVALYSPHPNIGGRYRENVLPKRS